LVLLDPNGRNVFGQTADRASLSGACTKGHYLTPGSLTSNLNAYINASCFTEPAPFSADDPNAVGFGNSGVGIYAGPGQNNFDLSLTKRFPFHWPRENSFLEFRSEFFNAFNHRNSVIRTWIQFTHIRTDFLHSVAPRIVSCAEVQFLAVSCSGVGCQAVVDAQSTPAGWLATPFAWNYLKLSICHTFRVVLVPAMASDRPSGDGIAPKISGLLEWSRTETAPSSATFSKALSDS
jgi:hypothetical protein